MKIICPHCGKEIEIEVKGVLKVLPDYPEKKEDERYKT